MIIWGSKGKIKEVGKGQFYCPACRQLRPYVQKKIVKVHHVYFIPLFETAKQDSEFIECCACGLHFKMEVLDLKP